MLKLASTIIGLPIKNIRDGLNLGEVRDFVVDPVDGEILAISLKPHLFSSLKIISLIDIREINPEMVIVDSSDVLSEPEEVIRVKEVLGSGIKILKNKVVTESGQKLGEVYDFTFDLIEKELSRIYVKGNFIKELLSLSELIIPKEKIIKITPKAIYVEDGVIGVKEKEVKAPLTVPETNP